nr:FG-GAP repeat protein [Ferruginibacter sp.]
MIKLLALSVGITALPLTQKMVSVQSNKPAYQFKFVNTITNNLFEQKKETKTSSPEDLKQGSWYSNALQHIEQSEYQFKWEEKFKAYCTPNRKNNLRFFYTTDGFSAEPRTTKIPLENYEPTVLEKDKKYKYLPNLPTGQAGWKINFNLDKTQIGEGSWSVTENKAEYITDNITVQYINNKEGMRQNFIVYKPLSKSSELKINLQVKTKLKTRLQSNQLQFFHKNVNVLNYKDLTVWDANKKPLKAYFKQSGKGKYSIQVNTENAIYPITIDPLSSTPDSTPDDANKANALFGRSVASAGDVNGDGYSDVIIGAYGYDDGVNADEGRAFVYHGSTAGLSATPNSTPDDANQTGAFFGISVASAGDVNGDGYSDVIIGAYGYNDGAVTDEGRAYVYHGSAAGLSASPNSTPDDANQVVASFGWSVASAGDVNGDGYSDVIVGASYYDDGVNFNEGRAFVYHGSAAGLNATPNSTPDDANQTAALFGGSVASAGDVNGDGYSDVIIGATGYDDGANTDEGWAFVYHGSAAGLSATPNSTPDDANQATAYFGTSVVSAGDVNGDGYSDVIIGAYLYDDGANSNEGWAFVYHGSAAGLSSSPNSTLDDADQGTAYFGYSVASAGDINGDGYSDVIIGASGFDDGANTDEGRAFVYHGSAVGLSASPNSTPDDADQANARFGLSVASAGDVNGDGYSDVIIGALFYDDGANTDEGKAFVYHGSAAGLSASPNSTPGDADQASAWFGYSVASAGDVNGDGYSDVIIGALFYDDGVNTEEGRAFVYH